MDVDLSRLVWRKSSASGPYSDNCVEVAFVPSGDVAHIRDSKDPAGGMFSLSVEGWQGFLAAVPTIGAPQTD